MLALLITETAKNEPSRFHLYNNILLKFKNNSYDFEILTFMKDNSKHSKTFRTLKVKNYSSFKTKYKIINIIIFICYLIKKKPQKVFIGGYGYLEHWIALFICKILFIDKILWTGASSITSITKSKFIESLKKFFINQFDVSITYGSNAAKYLMELGFKKKIFIAKNISDVESFEKFKKIYVNSIEYKKKKSLGYKQFIFSGRLEKHKGCLELIKCFKKIDKSKYFLHVVGSGSLEKLFIKYFNRKIINGKFYGKLNQINFAKILIQSDFYIMPTLNDPFTRTLSEALACNTFSINSCYDDASNDLIINKNYGLIFNPKRELDFYKKIKFLIDSRKKRENFIFLTKIFNTENYSQKFLNALQYKPQS
jgi:glycosyltransferase involved in cell wall biosynthesis